MNSKYIYIFFDLDNTLWDFEKNSRNAMFNAFHLFKLAPIAEFSRFFETYTKHNHALWDSYRKNKIVKKELTRMRFQNTFSELDIKGIDADEMNTIYLNEMPKQKELNEGVMDILNYLKKKRYKLNIITNGFREVQREKIETSGLKPYFDKIFISEEVKSPKPERGIFEYSIKSANAIKRKSIMVGDDWDVDVMGAVSYGINAVHYKKELTGDIEKLDNPLKNACDIYKIGTMSQLKYFL